MTIKVGSRVEYVRPSPSYACGVRGTVIEVIGGDGWRDAAYKIKWDAHEIMGVSTEAAVTIKEINQFKVGDVVAPTETSRSFVLDHWARYWGQGGRPDKFHVVSASVGINDPYIGISDTPSGKGPFWSEERFEKVDSAADRPCIVAVEVNGIPQPASRPFVHPNSEAAKVEAERLSVAHPGSTFTVYEAVSRSLAPVPPKPVAATVSL